MRNKTDAIQTSPWCKTTLTTVLGLATALAIMPATARAGERVTNGGFTSNMSGWSNWQQRGGFSVSSSGSNCPSGGSGNCARIDGNTNFNGGIWQQISLVSGQTYTLSVTSRDWGTNANAGWAEIHVGNSPPSNGSDYNATLVKKWDTFACNDWNGTAPCVTNNGSFNASSSTMYVVMKNGQCCGSPARVSWDSLSINGPDPCVAPATPGSPGPQSPSTTGITTNAINWTWSDNSGNETGFEVYADPGSGSPTTLRTTTAAGATSYNYTGLGVNTQHSFQVNSTISGSCDSPKTANLTRYTLANTPAAPTVGGAGETTLNVNVNANGNPSNTEFAITIGGGAFTLGTHWVQSGGNVSTSTIWQTDGAWGNKTVTGLANSTTYTFQVRARNGDNIQTALSSGTNGTTTAGCNNVVTNGGFGSGAGWTTWQERGSGVTHNFNSTTIPAGGTSPAYRVTGNGFNGGAWQAMSLSGGISYTVNAISRDVNTPANNGWAELHIGTSPPSNGSDYNATLVKKWDTFSCDNWNGSPPCVTNSASFTPSSTGTYYLVLKNGDGGTNTDVTWDDIQVCGPACTPPNETLAVAAQSSTICTGTGTNINVSSSESGVSYQLRVGTTNVGSPVNGNGGTISLPTGTLTSSTTFNVLATRTAGGCQSQLTQTATVTVGSSPTAPSSAVVDRNNLCSNDSGNIELTAVGGSGTTLRWYAGSCGGSLVGSGTPLTIASPTSTTTYFARFESTCGNSTCASITVNVTPTASNPGPAAVSGATGSTINVAINAGDSSSSFYSIRVNGGAFTNQWVQASGAVGATQVWQTKAAWGTKTVTGLGSGDSYCFDIRAAADASGTCPSAAFSTPICLSTLCTNQVYNGDFTNGSSGWVAWQERGSATRTYNSTSIPDGGSGNALRVTQNGNFNGGVYQVLSLVGGQTYSVSALSRDVGTASNAGWGELHIGATAPVNGSDYNATLLKKWDTFACDNWGNGGGSPSSSVGCVTNVNSYTVPGSGAQTLYLVLKQGQNGSGATIDVSWDDLRLCGPCTPPTASLTVGPQGLTVCPSTSVTVTVAGTQFGVNYQLRNGTTNIGTAVAGNGGTINLPAGVLTSTTTFNVLATKPEGSCSLQLTQTATVTVDDTTPPVISSCGSNQTATASASCQAPVPNYTATISATDNCTATGSLIITQSPVVGTLLGVGVHTITISVEDAAGNVGNCTRTFTVNDTTPPVITGCPAPQSTTGGASCQGTIPNFVATTTATDNCTASGSLTITQSPTAGTVVGVGAHSVTITVKDAANNTATCNTTFTVNDVTAPTITACAAPQTLSASATCEALVPDFTAGTSATDNCTPSAALTKTQTPVSGSVVGLGVTPVTVTVKDAAGNSVTCNTSLTVNDTTPPTITACSSDKSANADATCQAAVPDFITGGQVTATDDCTPTGSIVIAQSPSAGTLVGPGIHTVTITATDNAGNAVDCTRDFTVTDVTAPVIALNNGVSTHECVVTASNQYVEAGATVTDNCDGPANLTASGTLNGITLTIGGDAPDTTAVGVYVVTYDAVDAAGNVATQVTRTITVQDTQAPAINSLPADLTVECEGPGGVVAAGNAAIQTFLNAPEANDACDPAVGITNDAPAVFPIGDTTVTWSAQDTQGNPVTAQRVVHVVDTTAPAITLNGSSPVIVECQDTYTELGASVSDLCDSGLTSAVIGGDVVDTTTPGTYVVTYDATDIDGNAATQVLRTVTVQDTTKPVITLNGSASVTVECHSTYTELGASVVDACDASLTSVTIGGDVVNANAVGTYVVSYSATDAAGNAADVVTRTVTVVDTTPPTITVDCSTLATTVSANAVTCVAAVPDFTGSTTASDLCATSGSLTKSQSPPAGSMVGLGAHTVTITVTDPSGNATDCDTTFTVEDTTAPVIALVGDSAVTLECAVDTYTELGATVTDGCDAGLTSVVIGGDTVNTNVPGTYVVTYDATDASGNAAAQVVRTVIVSDTVAPVITLNNPSLTTLECHVDSYTEPGASVSDACDLSLTTAVVGGATVDPNTTGTYVVTYNATDASGNASTQVTRAVTVQDTLPPTITSCGPGVTLSADATCQVLVPSMVGAVVASDECSTALTLSQVPAVGTPVGLGVTTVTITVADAAGNESTCDVDLTVEDTAPPVLTLNGASTVNIECHLGSYTESGASVSDNCDSGVVVVVGGDTVDVDTPGTYVVTYDATDASGNSAVQLSRTVIVADGVAPTISLNGTDPVTIECHLETYTEQGASVLDDCDTGLTAATVGGDIVDVDTPGVYIVTYDATDASGNHATQVTRTVNVVDTTPPNIVACAAPVTASADGGCFAIVPDFTGGITVGDACSTSAGSLTITQSPLPGTSVTLGATVITVTATDPSGNAANCDTTFTVEDTTPPVISLLGPATLTLEANVDTYTEQGAVVSDNCDTGVTVVIGGDTVNTAVVGTYVVTYDSTDASGNAAVTVTRTVDVVDTIPPSFTQLPADIILECQGPAGVPKTDAAIQAFLDAAEASDSTDPAVGITNDAPDDFPIGDTTVTWTAQDMQGNSITASRVVTVEDSTAPEITLVGLSAEILECSQDTYTEQGATVSDLCDDTLTTATVGGDVVDDGAVGTYVVTYDATDVSGNAADQATRTIAVEDTTAPTITTCPAAVTVSADASCQNVLPDFTAQVVASDLCSTTAGSLTVTQSPAANTVVGLGVTTVTLTVTDPSGNGTTCDTTFTVEDTTAPGLVLTGPSTVTLECHVDSYVEEGATASDACDAGVGVMIGGDTVDADTPGSYIVTYDATDASGNAAPQLTRIVNVVDTLKPTITLNGAGTLTIECHVGSYTEAGANVADVCDLGLTSVVIGGDTVDADTPGIYVVTYDATDASGNAADQVTRTITVQDTIAPVVTLTGPSTVTLECHVDAYVEQGATVTDDCDLTLSAAQIGGDSVDVNTPGTYLVTYGASDASGNAAVQVSRTVTVVDTLAPTITACAPAQSASVDANCVAPMPNFVPTLIATDECALAGALTITQSPTAGTLVGVGSHNVTLTVTDPANNVSSCNTSFDVSDTTPPLITLNGPSNITLECYVDTYVELGASATDNCDTALTVVVGGDTVDADTPGSYTVTYNVTDAAGNAAAEVTRTITVVDTIIPVITLTGPGTVILEHNVDTYTELGATVADACDELLSAVTIGGDTVNSNALGTYVVTYDAVDASGNFASQVTRTVQVVDTIPPSFVSLPSDLLIECEGPSGVPATNASIQAFLAAPVASDLCDPSVGIVNDAPAVFPIGSTVVTWTAQDFSGNAVNASRSVNVADTTPPVIVVTGPANLTLECHLDTYTEQGAVANDLCAGSALPVSIGGDAVDTESTGTYVVTYNAVDDFGNVAAEETRTIQVVDTTPPLITLTGSSTVVLECHSGAYNEEGATAVDDCGGESVPVTIAGDSVDVNTPGTYLVTYDAIDDEGNAAVQVVRTVIVEDTIKPVITLIGSPNVEIECHQGTYTELGATVADTCDTGLTAVTIGGDVVDPNSVGTYTVVYSAVDASGNAADDVTRTVTVVDTIPPTIALNGDATVTIECGVPFADPGATGTDLCDNDVTILVSGNLDVDTPGIYTVTYHATDDSGNASDPPVTRQVIVTDTDKPVITLNGPSPMVLECGVDNYYVNTEIAAGTVVSSFYVHQDNDEGMHGTPRRNGSITFDADVIGIIVMPRRLIASDAAVGLSTVDYGRRSWRGLEFNQDGVTLSLDRRTVTIEQRTTHNRDHVRIITAPIASTPVTSGDLQWVATPPASVSRGDNENDNFMIAFAEQQSVTLADVLLADIVTPGTFNHRRDLLVDPGATVTDACDETLTTADVHGHRVNVDRVGTYRVHYKAKDAAGNRADSVTRIVIVQDTLPPIILTDCSTLATTAAVHRHGKCHAHVPNFKRHIDATDECTKQGSLRVRQSPHPGSALGIGTHDITITVTDRSGNTASCTIPFTVVDDTPPKIRKLYASPHRLKPANQDMEDISLQISLKETCQGGADCAILSVVSDEADSGLFDDDLPGDIEITPPLGLKLRAELDPDGNGRVYTVTVECVDTNGNSATKDVSVVVPRKKKHHKRHRHWWWWWDD